MTGEGRKSEVTGLCVTEQTTWSGSWGRKNMKKIELIKRGIMIVMTSVLMAGMLTACAGKDKSDDKAASESADEDDDKPDEKSDGEQDDEDKNAESGEDPLGLEGEWVMVYSLYHSEYGNDAPYDSCTMATDEYSPDSVIRIAVKDGEYVADFKYSGYESDYRYYGMKLEKKDEPAYDDCDNRDWCLKASDPFGDEDFDKCFTKTDDDTLICVSEYHDDGGEDGEDFYSVNRDVYIRSTDPRLENKEDLRYFDTVEVSDVDELLNSLQDNRKIILKAGTYDLSLVNDYDMLNKKVSKEWGAYKISDLYNLCLEAKEGDEVYICVDDAYSPVMYFYGCGNITVRDITVGHNVEPGYCSGSVLQYEQTSGITIDKCRLFGSGTYGIQANGCGSIEVTDTDIYECTYGLVDFYSVYNARFKNCTLRDSSDLSMINLNSSSDIVFDDCELSNNKINPEYSSCYFVEMSEYSDITFNRCLFKDNQYKSFSNNKVKMNHCTISDNGDITNIETEADADASELRRKYKDACSTQEQIDLKFQAGNMDQATMNQTAYEEYALWDALLNDIWAYLKETLDEDKMEALTAEEKEWVKQKEASVAAAGAEMEGGTMQPTLEYGTGATITRERVEYLMEQYIK